MILLNVLLEGAIKDISLSDKHLNYVIGHDTIFHFRDPYDFGVAILGKNRLRFLHLQSCVNLDHFQGTFLKFSEQISKKWYHTLQSLS